jgi:chorismate mutase
VSSDLDKLRREIDRIDDELLAALARRAELARRIGELKGGTPAYRPEREAEILRRIVSSSKNIPGDKTAAIFREIISACRGLEEAIRVAYLGPEGTFSEQAVRKHFGGAVEARPVASVDEAFRSAEAGATQFTVVPVENSTDGVVGRTLDLLTSTPLRICGEIELRVQQNLLSKEKSFSTIKKIYSHSQSLAQCNGWLGKNLPKAARIPVASNAEAAQRAAKEKGAAAIAGLLAGERYKLGVLARSIGRAVIGYPWLFREIKHYLQTGEQLPAPTVAERIEVCKQQLQKSLQWKGPVAGVYSMRKQYLQYLKGLPGISAFRTQLVTHTEPEALHALLDDIAHRYEGYEMERTPIELVNYHENCPL